MSTKSRTTQPTNRFGHVIRWSKPSGSKGITDEKKMLEVMNGAGWTETTATEANPRLTSGYATHTVYISPPTLASGRKKGEGKQYHSIVAVARQHYPQFLTDEQKARDEARLAAPKAPKKSVLGKSCLRAAFRKDKRNADKRQVL